ncbi:hypothetical protein, partial [Acinetobacter baumannii]|uniref:hypothetical protein n=1 Tax=Acinetobacter baumannii TaxID=470 RepID=UPI001BC87C94
MNSVTLGKALITKEDRDGDEKKMAVKRKNIIIVALGLLLSHHILAQQTLAQQTLAAHQALETDLSVQVNQFFQQQYPDKESQVKVVIKTPQNQWPQCDAPEITLPANARP